MQIYVQSTLLKQRLGVKPPRFDASSRVMMANKINGMLVKSYLETGSVLSHLHYFAVPKGESDIRVVYGGTSSGLNDSLWSPNFFLPTARNSSELLSFESWMSDMDFGEFFHNFPMDYRIRKYSGVNVKPLGSHVVETGSSSSKLSLR